MSSQFKSPVFQLIIFSSKQELVEVKTLWEGHKIWKNLPPFLTKQLFSLKSVKTSWIFFQILWPCHNAWTLIVMTYVTGRPQDRLRHDVGAGGRHHGANRTHSNAYEAYPTWSSFQNLRHALGRRIEVGHFFHVFFFLLFFHFLLPPDLIQLSTAWCYAAWTTLTIFFSWICVQFLDI